MERLLAFRGFRAAAPRPLARFRSALVVVVLIVLLDSAGGVAAATGSLGALTFTNPVLGQGHDPSVVMYHGWYYFTQSGPDGTYLTVRRSRSLKSLAAASERVVWRGRWARSPCCEWWAPELHHLRGAWYIYTAADSGSNDRHRLQVMRASDPFGPYTYLGQLTTPGNHWSIDPSPLALPDGQLYLFWSGWPGLTDGRQNIYIARMSEPWKVVGSRVTLSTPTFPWELQSGGIRVKVNESPEPIVHGGEVSVTYSASGCWTAQYSLGLLSVPATANLLNARSWRKARRPLFSSNPRAGIYGPASNGWFTSPDGQQTWMVFGAADNPAGSCGEDRHVFAQPITWNADGTPDLGGSPLPRTTHLRLPSGDPG